MKDQRVEANSYAIGPSFAAQVVSWRKSLIGVVLCHIPPGDLPVLEPWYPQQIFGSIDHPWWKAILPGRVFLDDVVNIISRFWR